MDLFLCPFDRSVEFPVVHFPLDLALDMLDVCWGFLGAATHLPTSEGWLQRELGQAMVVDH